MGTTMRIGVPEDYVLRRDACSYGYFVLAPNHWDPDTEVYHRVLDLAEGPSRVAMRQGERPGSELRAVADRALTRAETAEARRRITRMLRLDEDAAAIAAFHRLDRRWKKNGRGRLMRSPTLFEDVVKTVTSCNVQWPSTVHMNERLCTVLGKRVRSARRGEHLPTHSFPSAARMARTRPETLRSRCRVGYRDKRLVELAGLFAPRGRRRAEIDEGWLEDPAIGDDEVHALLLSLPGIGPYAAANIMQLLGRYGRLPLDTESVRHGRAVLGFEGSDAQVMRQVARHFEPFGSQGFRSYWFEMWSFYEGKSGPAHTWDRRTTATSFTASQLK
jgi:3-methyladenine DNA glycosylase/8-oxoguanine DNA glycosylase